VAILMDSYGQIGPDKPNYEHDVAAVREVLALGETVALRFAARMTARPVVLARLSGMTVFGAPTGGFGLDPLFVGVEGHWATYFPAGYVHWTDVARNGSGWGDDAEDHPFTDFLNALLWFPAPGGSPEQTAPSGDAVVAETSG
jgi:hypothetical protein